MSKSLMPFVDLKAQYTDLRDEVNARIQAVLDHGQYIMGPEVSELEERLADYVGVKHCIAASSGTDTLLIAMMALGIGPGDEVITTPFTFIATGEMIALLGAKPVFVDILPRTYNLDPNKIKAAVTARTRAIMPVSLYGQCADMDTINSVAVECGLAVIEDAAQSFGATYKGRRSGGLSKVGSTSFFPSKPLGCYGDGGALFTDDDDLAKAMREIRVHGQDRRYHHPRIGINGRLDTMQAAVLLAKLTRFDWEVEQRAAIGKRYTELLTSDCPDDCCQQVQEAEPTCTHTITPPWIAPHNTSVYAQYTIAVDNRDQLVRHLNEQGVPTAVHYPVPLHLQPAFAQYGYKQGDFPVAEDAAGRVMSLPMSADLAVDTQEKIAGALIGCGAWS